MEAVSEEKIPKRTISWGLVVALLIAVVLAGLTVYLYWLGHPSDPFATTRIDDYLYDISYDNCGDRRMGHAVDAPRSGGVLCCSGPCRGWWGSLVPAA